MILIQNVAPGWSELICEYQSTVLETIVVGLILNLEREGRTVSVREKSDFREKFSVGERLFYLSRFAYAQTGGEKEICYTVNQKEKGKSSRTSRNF